jgi:CubicO group peptidase (beta-lactamase class C family)
MKYRLFLMFVAAGIASLPGQRGSAQEFPYLVFERYLEPLAQQIGMPGLSAVIVRNNVIAWERGYGYANVESKTPATIDTPYPIGGVTQAITGVLVGICADRHLLNVDADIRTWVPTFPDAGATVRKVLAHTSTGRYQYDAAKFTALTPVVESCTKLPYRVAATAEVIDRLALTRSVPGLDLNRPEGAAARALFEPRVLDRYLGLLNLVAVPYRIGRNGPTRSEYPSYGVDAARRKRRVRADRPGLVLADLVGRAPGVDLRPHSGCRFRAHPQDAVEAPDARAPCQQRRPRRRLQLRAGRRDHVAVCEGLSAPVHLATEYADFDTDRLV